MSDKILHVFSSVVVVILCIAVYRLIDINDESMNKITELKQHIKDSKAHADMKFNLCMRQLK